MATIRDVAKRAGVSVATVSHVVNGTRVVLPETRAMVLSAIRELNYRPSALARGLTTQMTKTIGVVIADVTSPFFALLLKQLESRLSVAGYNLLVCNTFEEPEREAQNLEMLLAKRVDGVVMTPTGFAQPVYEQFAAHRIPLVFIDRQPPGARGDFVGTDNWKACYDVTRYLIDLGHRRIGMISLTPETSAVTARLAGYRQALAESGIVEDSSLLVATALDRDAATAAARNLLALDHPPTALIASSHFSTLGALRALADLKLRYPDDLSLVCFDNSTWTDVIQPPLTVVTKPIPALARAAVDMLLDSIAEVDRQRRRRESLDSPPQRETLLEAEMIVRESSRSVSPALARPYAVDGIVDGN